jgi:hypothetical protein
MPICNDTAVCMFACLQLFKRKIDIIPGLESPLVRPVYFLLYISTPFDHKPPFLGQYINKTDTYKSHCLQKLPNYDQIVSSNEHKVQSKMFFLSRLLNSTVGLLLNRNEHGNIRPMQTFVEIKSSQGTTCPQIIITESYRALSFHHLGRSRLASRSRCPSTDF